MSANDFPLVSGTLKYTKNVPTMLKAAKIQNVGPIPIAPLIDPNDDATMKVRHGFIAPVNEDMMALTSLEYNSLTSNQGIGPKPSAKATM